MREEIGFKEAVAHLSNVQPHWSALINGLAEMREQDFGMMHAAIAEGKLESVDRFYLGKIALANELYQLFRNPERVEED